MSQESCFRELFDNQRGNRPKHCWNLNDSTFTIFFDHDEGNWSEKKSLLVMSKILNLFVNTLTANDKYSPLNRQNLTQRIQILLCETQETVPHFFFFFFFFCSFQIQITCWTVSKQDDTHSWCISEVSDSEKGGQVIVEKVLFRWTLWQASWQTNPDTIEIWATATLLYFLITVARIETEKVSLGDMQNVKTDC